MNNIENRNNYSNVDGSMNYNINGNSFTIEKSKDLYCGKCGNKAEYNGIYCKYCGANIEKFKSKNISFKNTKEEKFSFKDMANSFSLNKCLMTSAFSTLILLVFSLIIKSLMFGSKSQLGELINTLHIMLLSNFGSIEVDMNSFMSNNMASVNIGLLALIILPIISITISYKLFLKRDNISLSNHIKNSLGVGVIYSLILSVIAKISQINWNYSSEFGQYSYNVNYGFTMSSVLFKGFIIGFVCVLLLGLKKEYENDNLYVGILRLVTKVLGIGYIITFAILVIMYFSNINYLNQLGISSYASKFNIVVVLCQLSLYIWSFANFIPTMIGNNTLSIGTILGSKVSFDLLLILGAFMSISILIFIIVGCKLESKYGKQGIKPVIVFSILYSISIGVLGLLTVLYVSDTASSIISILNTTNMGYNFIIGMILSFVYSLITTLIGFKLNISNNLEEKYEG